MKVNGKKACSFGEDNLLEIKIIRMLFSAISPYCLYIEFCKEVTVT
jgi:hypothetical protein